MTVAIIGAGLAGLTCAAGLKERGIDVSLFDKGRGPGGRMSTRRAETPLGQVRFDHGAQYMSPQSAEFGTQIEAWATAGHVARWDGRLVELDARGEETDLSGKTRWVGVPSMNGLIRALAAPFDVSWSARVENLSGRPGAWLLDIAEDAEQQGPFESVLFAIPAEQTAPLLADTAPSLAKTAARVVSAPSWTLMLAFETPLPTGYDAARVSGQSIDWMARNASKPGRGPAETWVVQASPEWSQAHLEDPPDKVTSALTADFQKLTGAPEPIHSAAHRWRYAQASEPAGIPCQYDHELAIGTCGDWHLGGNCEHAWLSGSALTKTFVDKSG